jgi:aryl-alcohol dehydrogenase-like predicted oxidoreductase
VKMEQRTLGKSGIRASRIGLGCATFGREIREETAFRIMDYAVERGITLFDTAEGYGGGQARQYRKKRLGLDDEREVSGEMHSSEKIIGRWLRASGMRKRIVLLTKVATNFTRQHVREALHASLERLQTDAVDLYLYHSYDSNTPAEESVAAMGDALDSGLVRAGGCSNYSGAQLAAALNVKRVFEVIESNYNLVAREIQQDVLPLARRESIGVLTYSPLAAGFLMGKYTPDRSALPKGTRFHVIPDHADVYFSERNFRWVALLQGMSERIKVPAARLAMAWVFQNTAIDVVLVGARSTEHLDNALEAIDQSFAADWLAETHSWT